MVFSYGGAKLGRQFRKLSTDRGTTSRSVPSDSIRDEACIAGFGEYRSGS